MTKVFIGGSRQVSRLNADVRQRLERMVERRLPVLVGDANGADKAVQRFFHEQGYPLVEVFCSGSERRNNLGGWPERHVEAPAGRRDFAFFAAKDAAMAREASVGFMIWDQKSVGTLMNVQRLVGQHKTVVVYLTAERRFVDLKTPAEWDAFLARCAPDVRRQLHRRDESRPTPSVATRQAGLF